MHRQILTAALLALLALVAACSDDGTTPPDGNDVTDDSDSGIVVIDPDADVAEDDVRDVEDDVEPDVAEDADATPDVDVRPPDIGEDTADIDAGCGGVTGCECINGNDCLSGWCVPTDRGPAVCSELCDEGACPTGFDCRWREDQNDVRVQLCVARALRFCRPCTRDDDCGIDGACLAMDDGSFCAPACGPNGLCAAGSRCGPISEADRRRVCQPPANRCIGCTDLDSDGYIATGQCGGLDCADNDPNVNPAAPELCNDADDDCDSAMDEAFDLGSDRNNCGACGVSCPQTTGSTVCIDGACAVTACNPGRTDCNFDGSDGCEISTSGTNGCGVCPGPDNILHGNPCGMCGSGTWQCSAGTRTCVGDLGNDARNACGGCAEFELEPGEDCGTCGSGTVVCSTPETTRCANDLGDAARNGCGGCTELEGPPGAGCGTCGSGEYACSGTDRVVCLDDEGDGARNACGGCAPLEGAPGSPCGACDSGTYACDGGDALFCIGEQPGLLNACGGCDVLSQTPGTTCGECGDGVYGCSGLNEVTCQGATIPGPDGCPDPLCEGRDEGRLGDACTDGNDCCNGNCAIFAPRDGVCSQTCSRYTACNTDESPVELFCALGEPRTCAPNDYNTPCTSGTQCAGSVCLQSGPGDGGCSWRCEQQSDCAGNMVCGRFGAEPDLIRACTTIGGDCTTGEDCRSGVCLTGTGAGYCTAQCTVARDCPAGYSCSAGTGGEMLCRR